MEHGLYPYSNHRQQSRNTPICDSFAAAPTRPRTVSVVGEVNRPGSYVVVGGSATATANRVGVVQEVGFLL